MPASFETTAVPIAPVSSERRWWAIQIIPQWDKNPRLVAQAATGEGKLALIGLFGVFLFFSIPILLWCWTMAVLLATALLPDRRRSLVTAGTLGTMILHGYLGRQQFGLAAAAGGTPLVYAVGYGAALAAIFGFGLLLFTAGCKWPAWGPMKRPVLSMNLLFAAFAAGVAAAPLSGALQWWARLTIVLMAGYLWYFAYSLQDRSARDRDPALRQIGTWDPFWVNASGAGTPFCKGAAYLRRIEARSGEELAVTQIKGVKLLMWCFLLRLAAMLFNKVAYGSGWGLALPDMDGLIASGRFPAWYICWGSLIASFVGAVLSMTVWGNTIVACCRLAGFRALRNTYRPFQSSSIAEFWNRYYYYFKELLVDFFFYPVYLRYFKRHRRLRMLAATLAAATFGNMLYHFFRDIDFVFQLGAWKAIAGFRVYALYTLILGIGIGISQIRVRRAAATQGRRWRIPPAVSVIGFFCILHVFDYGGRDHSIGQHMNFLLHLLNR